MSSRSKGVTKVLLTRWMISRVVPSAVLSASRISLALAAWSVPSANISASSAAPLTRCWADSVKSW
jgi:hypothetical protein